jgi:hypothetical protein
MAYRTFVSWTGKPTPGIKLRPRLYFFWACRCFLSEFRRVIRALASRTASPLVGLAFGDTTFRRLASSDPGMAGSTGTGIVELRSAGCIFIGPTGRDLRFSISDNALAPNSFDLGETR